MSQASPPATDPLPKSQANRLRRIVSLVVALALLTAAIIAVTTRSDLLDQTLRAAARAPAALIVAALLLPLANWLLMSLSFWVLTRQYGRVGLGEMVCLIGAAWLLNYLPLRPGLLGRVAYHKAVNGIAVRDSIRVTLTSIACAAVAIGALLAATLVASEMSTRATTQCLTIMLAPTLALGILAAALSLGPWRIGVCILLRYIDLLAWTARYMVVFAIIDQPISWPAAAAIAAVVQVAMLVPLVGNGLGLREWTVGLTSRVLPAGFVSSGGALSTGVGLAADLVNRATEVCCSIPVGLACSGLLLRRK